MLGVGINKHNRFAQLLQVKGAKLSGNVSVDFPCKPAFLYAGLYLPNAVLYGTILCVCSFLHALISKYNTVSLSALTYSLRVRATRIA